MATETELKLQLDAQDVAILRAHPLLAAAEHQAPQTLLNTYYDTPTLALADARVALRIRRQGTRFIQTLKTRGQSVNGLHQRGEWEWMVEGDALEPERLDASCWPDALPAAASLTLVPVFTTDFQRELWELDHAGARIEVALDQGEIRCQYGDQSLTDPLLELELELKSGDPEALHRLAEALSSKIRLEPFDISKAQRGYALFHQLVGS